jgi:hypothetical protein
MTSFLSVLSFIMRHIIVSIKTRELYAIGHVKRGIYDWKMEVKTFGIGLIHQEDILSI